MKLEDIRREYLAGGLSRENLLADPIAQFNVWLDQAITAQIPDPTAFTLATVGSDGRPSQRIVLLKQLDEQGFVFFTNYSSKKAVQMEANRNICIHFPWHGMERQVEVEGTVERISIKDSLKYFLSRPRDSQVAAWASHQSHHISSRKALLMQFEAMKAKFGQGDIPLPDFWGGYRVTPASFEFWQGGGSRLHDRFQYSRVTNTHWDIERLAP
ncbi:pyridoxamine 5'-phosphate oxidase [Teredinibacter haidensis]|uniref:pyridoxamine 5'-phosphate oxidase n=1 Tax=Teredinibacter haidensis TaxID=2731755 RepID=UPI000948FA9A|nr:pyridoxamine 5'-phosphate oxidase [Teredinibacter haidensis]